MNTDNIGKRWRIFCVFALLPSLLFSLSGCSLPKIIVLNDPLSAEEHMKLGSIYDGQGKTGLARDQFREAVQQDPRSVLAWSLLGDAAYKMKEYAEAKKAYARAIDLDPKSGDLRNNLAWVYVEEGQDLDTAQELIAKALDLTPGRRPYYLDTRGVLLLQQGKPHEAIAALKESTETIPKDQAGFLAEAYGHLADAYRAAGNDASAQEAAHARERLLGKQ